MKKKRACRGKQHTLIGIISKIEKIFCSFFTVGSNFKMPRDIYAFITPFILGSICARYGLIEKWCDLGTGKLWLKAYKAIAEIWVLIFFYYMYLGTPRDRFWDFHYGLFPMLLILFFVEYIYPLYIIRGSLMFLGKHSMNIYLVHSYVLLYFPYKIYDQKHFAVSIAILLGVCLLISMALEMLKKAIRYDCIV